MKHIIFLSFLVAMIGCSSPTTQQPMSMGSGSGTRAIPGAAIPISFSDARSQVRSYWSDTTMYKFVNGSDTLVSFFVDRNALETMLKDEQRDGVRLYLAKEKRSGEFTIVLVPTKPNANDSTQHNNVAQDLYNNVIHCPIYCNGDASTELK